MDIDLIVIGGGQAGLAAAYFLQQRGVRFQILDSAPEIGGSWQHYYRSLRLFSQARYSSLPGMPFPGDPQHYPTRDEVIAYLRHYAQRFELLVQLNSCVDNVTRIEKHFLIKLKNGSCLRTKAIIAASGPFRTPYLPSIAGCEQFRGRTFHAFDYREPSSFRDQHIMVVGGGETAIQIAIELATIARVTLASRHPLRFIPQRILGQDAVFWLHATGYDMLPISLGAVSRSPKIIEAGPYRRILASGNPSARPMFCRFTETGVAWRDGTSESVDTVVFATGYRPGLDYLARLNALDNTGKPYHKKGISQRVPGLYFIGLSGQRAQASATLRGVGADARYIVDKAIAYLAQ